MTSKMSNLLQAQVLNIAYGPMICEACYHVGTEVAAVDSGEGDTMVLCVDEESCEDRWN